MVVAFTLIEIVIVIGIIVILLTFLLPPAINYLSGTYANIDGTWTTSPPAVHQSPASATFVFSMKQKISKGTGTPISGHKLIIAVAPTTDVRIVNITDLSGSTDYAVTDNKITATTTTDAGGDVSVTIQTDHLGAGSVTAIDAKTNASEVADWTGVR